MLGYDVDSETDAVTRRKERDAKKKVDRKEMPPPARKIRYDSTPDAIDSILKAALTKDDAQGSDDYYSNVPEAQKAVVGMYRLNNYTNKVERIRCGAECNPEELRRIGKMTEAQYAAYMVSRRDETRPAPQPSMSTLSMHAGLRENSMYTMMTRGPDHDDPEAPVNEESEVVGGYEILMDDMRQRGLGREPPISTDPRVQTMRSIRLSEKLKRQRETCIGDLIYRHVSDDEEEPKPKRSHARRGRSRGARAASRHP